MRKRLLSMLLVVTLLLSLLPGAVLAIESENGTPTRTAPVVGRFPMLAITADGLLIEPCYVSYAEGETLKDALRYSGHTFAGLDSGFISAIDGNVDNYSLHYAGDGYSLDGVASDVTALWFTTNSSQSYSEGALELVAQMARYLDTADIGGYERAATAYANACDKFFSANADTAAALSAELEAALDTFDRFQTGQTVQLSMNITLGGVALTTGKAVFTSEFGTKTIVTELTSAALVPATYDFDISDGDFRHVRGSVVVDAGSSITADIPTGNWIADLELSYGYGTNWVALPKSDATTGGAIFYVADYMGPSLYPYVTRNEEYATDASEYGLYLAGKETKPGNKRTWANKSTSLSGVIEMDSLTDTEVVLECRRVTMDANGYELYQSYTMQIRRVPTLSNLTITSDGMQLYMPFDPDTVNYSRSVISDMIQLCPTANAGAAIAVNGQSVESGASTSVSLADCSRDSDGNYLVNVTLTTPNGWQNTYQLKLERIEPLITRLTMPDSTVTVELFTAGSALFAPASVDGLVWTYHTIPGESYTYISTANIWYHATASITPAVGKADFTVAAPKTEDWLQGLAAKASTAGSAKIYELNQDFDPAVHSYTTLADSNTSTFALSAFAIDTAKYTTTANYLTHNNSVYSDYSSSKSMLRKQKSETPGTSANNFKNLSNFMAVGGWNNDLTVRVQQKTAESGVTYYQEYALHVDRFTTMNTMSIADEYGNALTLAQKDAPETKTFDKYVLSYTTTLGARVPQLQLSFKPLSTKKYDHDFTVTVSCDGWSQSIVYSADVAVNVLQSVTVPMNGTAQTQTIYITVSHSQTGSVAQTYTIEVEKLPPITTTFVATPANAVVFLTDDSNGTRVYPEADGTYILNATASYTYVVSCNGYVAQKETFLASAEKATITVELARALESGLKDLLIDDDWPLFRADENNNGVISYRTPIRAEDTVLEWASKIGEGYGSGATGCPIIVGGYLYTYAGTSIVKVNKDTGEVVDSGEMTASSSFAINSPTYADGMIFVGLSGGRVQAFNAETLESLWVYTDPLGGQPNCPIAYCEGYVYTGFWNSETKKANFVCLSVTDEDPNATDEAKLATWSYSHNGFYWAGAYVCHDYVVVGTDDGESGYTTGYASILSFDPRTGVLLDEQKLSNVGDQRSSICYDADTDACYFTTKGGDFYQIRLNADGTFRNGSLRQLHLSNGSNNDATPPMSTSTPVIYNGRAYIGVSGTSQFGAYSGHNMTVIDLESFSIAYRVPTQGYPQTSGLLTTAYEGEDGYVYVYFIDNYTPGKLRVIRDKKGMTEVDHTYTTMETYESNGEKITIETGYVLFTPSGSEAQYAICSPIADSEGNLYFKNDTARLMRLSSRMESLEIVQQPDKVIYEPGMVFDGSGLQVKAHYANGNTKDVTSWISFSQEKLTEDDTELTISLDPDRLLVKEDSDGYWKWYGNVDGEAGQPRYLPTTSVTLELRTTHTGNATCNEEAACTVCGKKYLNPANHAGTEQWDSTETTHEKKYTCCGHVTYVLEQHTWENGACSVCGYQCQHADSGHDHTCDICESTVGEHTPAEGSHNCGYCGEHMTDHCGGKATCGAKAICEICGEAYGEIDPETHVGELNWVDQGEDGHMQRWSVCLHTAGNVQAHDHNGEEGECSVCGHGCAHTGGTATCSSLPVCEICGHAYGEVDSTNHANTELCNDENATCGKGGYTGDICCADCGTKLTIGEIIPATGVHIDEDKNHSCDVCQAEMGSHEAAEGSHDCAYCGKTVSVCTDEDHDHKCDICGGETGSHEAAEGSHDCAYCGKPISACTDENHDHKCDICGSVLTDCIDEDGNNSCDICGGEMAGEDAPPSGDIFALIVTALSVSGMGLVLLRKKKN